MVENIKVFADVARNRAESGELLCIEDGATMASTHIKMCSHSLIPARSAGRASDADLN